MQHDKHTYYFEKYLRKEMSREEKFAFEEKLNSDIIFKTDFDNYANNHDEILKQELDEYFKSEIIPSKPKNYTWIWVLISIIGLALIFDYYENQKYIEAKKQQQTAKEVIVDRFKNAFVYPFRKINAKKTESVATITTVKADENYIEPMDSVIENKLDSTKIENDINDQFHQFLKEKKNLTEQKDIFLNDSLMNVMDLEKFKENYLSKIAQPDSLLSDSSIIKPNFLSISKQTNNKPLFVEFWESVIGFSGYQFTGKKLVVYGIKKPFNIFILKQNNIYILHSNWGETALQPDNQLHKFED